MNFRTILILICLLTGLARVAMGQESVGPSVCLTLKDALKSADRANLQVMMANARLEQAIARISEAQSDMLPHLEGTVNGARQTADLRAEGIRIPIPGFGPHVSPFNSFDARARVTVALFDPSSFERFQAAKKGKDLSKAELEKTREDILGLVAALFVDAQRKQQSADLLETLMQRDQMAYELSLESLNQGIGTLLDSNKLRSDLSQTKYLFEQARLEAQDALLDLEAALQLPSNRRVIFLDDKDFLKRLQNAAAVNFNNADNADTAMASSELDVRKADQKSAVADFFPKVSGTANYGRSGESPGHGSNTYFVGLQASVPIWEGGAQQAKIKEVKGQVKEAQENLLDVTRQQEVNVVKARAAIVEAEDLREAKAQARQTAQRALRIAFHSQETGSGSVFEVMLAKSGLALAEEDYNEAQALWVVSHINLFHAEGRLRELIRQ